MHYSDKNKIYFLVSIFTIFIISYLIQTHTFLNWDVQSMFLFAKEILAGKDYMHGFWNNNPPFIFFLNTPLVLISQFFHIWPVTVIRIFTYFTCTLSLVLTHQILKLIFNEKSNRKKNILFFTIVFSYLILPAYEFGQREHLTIMFVLPYILLTVTSVLEKKSSRAIKIAAGIMAGIGIAIKPYFILIPIFNELYLLYKKRNIRTLIRFEISLIILIQILYVLMILLITPSFFSWVFNVILKYEISSATFSLKYILLHSEAPFLFFISLFCYLSVRKNTNSPNRELMCCLLVANFAFLLIYILPRRMWYYHELPSVTLSLIILILGASIAITGIEADKTVKNLFHQCSLLSVCIFAAFIPFYLSLLDTQSNLIVYANPKSLPNQFLKYINTYAPNGPVDVMTNTASARYWWALYTPAKPVSVSQPRAIYITPGITKKRIDPKLSKAAFKKATASLVSSYKKNQPEIIFIDQEKILPYTQTPFSFLKLYLKNAYFKKIWSEYVKVGQVKTYAVYINKKNPKLKKLGLSFRC